MKKSIVLDIDHTVSDAFWRDDRIPADKRGQPGDWDYYHSGLVEDKPIDCTVRVLRLLWDYHNILAVTARPEKWREATKEWLVQYAVPFDALLMRPDDNYRKASELKPWLVKRWYWERGVNDWASRVAFVLDDNAHICKAFNDLGVTAFQVFAKRSSHGGDGTGLSAVSGTTPATA